MPLAEHGSREPAPRTPVRGKFPGVSAPWGPPSPSQPPAPHPQPAPYQPPSPYQQPTLYQQPPPGYRPVVVPVGAGLPPPVAVEAVPGSPFGVAIVGIAPTTSGPAVASLVAGVGAILVSFVVICFGTLGAQSGWGPIVAGAFAVLAGLIGIAAIVLGRVGYRQIKLAVGWGATRGRGLAVAGMICGAVALVMTVFAVIFAVLESGPTT